MSDPERMAVWVPPDNLALYERQGDGYVLVEQRTANVEVAGMERRLRTPLEWGPVRVQVGWSVDPDLTFRPDLYRRPSAALTVWDEAAEITPEMWAKLREGK